MLEAGALRHPDDGEDDGHRHGGPDGLLQVLTPAPERDERDRGQGGLEGATPAAEGGGEAVADELLDRLRSGPLVGRHLSAHLVGTIW